MVKSEEAVVDSIPANLPTATTLPSWYVDTDTENNSVDDNETEDIFTEIENYAHRSRVLLSSDAIRAFVKVHGSSEGIFFALGKIIENGKSRYPSDDGWVVLSLERMQVLLQNGHVGAAAISTSALSHSDKDVDSLAEAIATGNVSASYRMIADRPMLSLAEATVELDSIYRLKKGLPLQDKEPSSLLKDATANYSVDEIRAMIDCLNTALDGSYTDEASAVKMAVLKAIGVGA